MTLKKDFFERKPNNKWDWRKLLKKKEDVSIVDVSGRIEYWKDAKIKISEEELKNI
jgi:hypothetical protein